MWAAHEDSDDEAPGRGKRSAKKGGSSMNAPVNFISGGFKKTAKEEIVRIKSSRICLIGLSGL